MKLQALAPAALSLSLICGVEALAAQNRPIPLDTLRVSASSRASAEMATATRGVEVITADELRRMPARSVAEALQWALSVDVMPRSPALVDVALRGSSFEQVLVMVDGVRVSDAQTGHFDLDLAVPLDQVERIEILRGPASTLHGADAVGGVINVVTRAGGASRGRVETGSFGTVGLALALTQPLGRFRADVAADARRSGGHRAGTDYEAALARAALVGPLGGRTLRADAAWAGRDFGANGFYGSNPKWNEYEETRTTTASVAWQAGPSSRIVLEPVVSFRRHGDEFLLKREDPAFYRNQHATDQLGAEVTARFAPLPEVRLAAGVEAYLDRLESQRLGDRSERRGALLGELAAGRVGRLTGSAGIRADWQEAHGLFVSPALAAAWWPAAGVRLRGSAGRALRVPTWTERYYRDPAHQGDPSLRPERAWSGEVGADLYPVGGVRVAGAVFVRSARDLIDWAKPATTPDAPWTMRNVEDATFRGLEAELGVDDVLGLRWTGRGSWLSVASSAAPSFTSKYALRPLAESFSVAAERAVASGLGGSLRALRARRLGEEAYLRLDARAVYELARFRLHVDLQNLSDTGYPDIMGLPAPGRALVAGVEVRSAR